MKKNTSNVKIAKVAVFEELFSDAGQGETRIANEPYFRTVKSNSKFQRRDALN